MLPQRRTSETVAHGRRSTKLDLAQTARAWVVPRRADRIQRCMQQQVHGETHPCEVSRNSRSLTSGGKATSPVHSGSNLTTLTTLRSLYTVKNSPRHVYTKRAHITGDRRRSLSRRRQRDRQASLSVTKFGHLECPSRHEKRAVLAKCTKLNTCPKPEDFRW